MSRFLKRILSTALFPILLGSFLLYPPSPALAGFDPNELISDAAFTQGSANTDGLQAFLETGGSFLARYTDGGRSAAQIIFEAARGITSSGKIDGKDVRPALNPFVIIATLQKEQSLITLTDYDINADPEGRLRKAMGYACPEGSGCDPAYAGFISQVELGARQLYFNYMRAEGMGYSDYQVGQSKTFSDHNGQHTVTFKNRATSALYRYTPHVYNGNYNFWKFFNEWATFYASKLIGQSPHPPAVSWRDSLKLIARFQNTGSVRWTRDRTHLAAVDKEGAEGRTPGYLREGGEPSGWSATNKVFMKQGAVEPGETGDFEFWIRIPQGKGYGAYREYFRLEADDITQLENIGLYWDVQVGPISSKFQSEVTSQSNAHLVLRKGETRKFSLSLKNAGSIEWDKSSFHLEVVDEKGRMGPTPVFLREPDSPTIESGWVTPTKAAMKEDRVHPDETAHFEFWMKVPDNLSPAIYKTYFRPEVDDLTQLENRGMFWLIKVE